MIPAYRKACLVLALFLATMSYGQSTAPIQPPDVQHFGPLVVVAMHEDAPEPLKLCFDMFNGGLDGRMRALRAIGIDSNPEIKALWSSLLKEHQGMSEEQVAMLLHVGWLEENRFGEIGSQQAILVAGFEDLNHRLDIRGVFDKRDGHWVHIASFACQCEMHDRIEPFNLRNHQLDSTPRDLAVHLQVPPDNKFEWHWQEIRFRLRSARFWPVLQFESASWNCPRGRDSEDLCTGIDRNLEQGVLEDEHGNTFPGFVLIAKSETDNMQVNEDPVVLSQSCTPYIWDDASFSYVLSHFELKTCGHPSTPPKKRAVTQKTAPPATGSTTRQ